MKDWKLTDDELRAQIKLHRERAPAGDRQDQAAIRGWHEVMAEVFEELLERRQAGRIN